MMKKMMALVLAGSFLTGCTSTGGGYGGGYNRGPGMNEGLGTIGGAVLGGVIGNQFGRGGGKVAATIAGAAIGGIIGNRFGALLDAEDQRRASAAEYAALNSGRTGTWRNPNNGRYGQVVPGPVQGDCRTYTHTIYIEGRPETAQGQACRNPNGTWSPVS